MIGEFYDREGKPISSQEWGRLHRQLDYVRIGWDVLADPGVEVSTVWLGIDHNYLEEGPAIIFETMIFGGDKYQDMTWRYTTEEEAREGHRQACALIGLILVEQDE